MSADLAYFRSLHYGFADPTATICLWWAVWPDQRVRVLAEGRWQQSTIQAMATAIKKQTDAVRYRLLTPKEIQAGTALTIRYTVADEDNIGSEDGDGETRAETFRKNGIPMTILKPDPVQGWTRVRELLGLRPDGQPWLTIDPSCEFLIRAITSAVQDKTDPEDVLPFGNDQPLKALRIGAMSRPAPKWSERPPLPKHAIGRLVDDLRADVTSGDPSSSSGLAIWK